MYMYQRVHKILGRNVLDGTLTGFSIGGKIKDSDNEVNKVNRTSCKIYQRL
jgi:hypothetical protein